MRVPVKSLLVSIAVFLCCVNDPVSRIYVPDRPGSQDVINDINNSKLFLYKYGMVEKLSSNEITRSIKIPVENVTAKT